MQNEYKRAFYRLEQELLKSKTPQHIADCVAVKGGVDFCFASKHAAERFVQLLSSLAPVRTKTSSKTRSEDLSQHTANVQTTYCVDLCPIAKYDLVLLPQKMAQRLGCSSRAAVCTQTTGQLRLVNPRSGRRVELTRDKYWQTEFAPWETSASLTDFVVLDVEEPERSHGQATKQSRSRDVEVARARDFGVNDTTFIVRSHLADELEVGDRVKGYDLTSTNLTARVSYLLGDEEAPDVVLVRRCGAEKPETPTLKRLVESEQQQAKKSAGRAEAAEFAAFALDYIDEIAED